MSEDNIQEQQAPTEADLAGLFAKVRENENAPEQTEPETVDDPVDESVEQEIDTAPDEEELAGSDEELGSDPDENQDNAQPAIQPPAGMSANDAAIFAKATPEMQAWMVQQEANRSANLTQKTQELASERKKIKAQSAELTNIIERQRAALSGVVEADIRAPDPKLRMEDPEAYEQAQANYLYAKDQKEQAEKQLAEAEQEQVRLQEEQLKTFTQERNNQLVSLIPDLGDATKAAKVEADLKQYITANNIGDESQIAFASAPQLNAVYKAMLYDRAIAAGSAVGKKSNTPPKAQKPGAAKSPKSTAQTKQRAKTFEDLKTKAASGNATRHDLAKAYGAFKGR